MTFLGVWLHTAKSAQRFVDEVSTMTHITTIILQTHIVKPHVPGDPCISAPISQTIATELHPSFEVAQQAVALLRAQGDKFRVLFSSTLGVMLFVGAQNSEEPTAPNQACEQSYMVDNDFTCSDNVSHAKELYNEGGMYVYSTYKSGSRRYFVTYETIDSLEKKVTLGLLCFSVNGAREMHVPVTRLGHLS
ncbi:hypothetical protein V5799_015924 [Amblyomma americanum]|uniref:Uncharacterized protein n=1 Tax=Amblyomma americanum TaxID=6943 RepID=A0AAQ4F7T9_AMBAM